MRLPSGDQRGDSSNALCGTSTLLSVPSALTVLICNLPSVPWSVSQTKTIFLPSGDQWPSKCGVVCGSRAFSSPLAASTVHSPILPWWIRVQSSRLPSGDQLRCCLKLPSRVRRTTFGASGAFCSPRFGGEGSRRTPSPPTPLPRSGGEGSRKTPSPPPPLPRFGGEGRKRKDAASSSDEGVRR